MLQAPCYISKSSQQASPKGLRTKKSPVIAPEEVRKQICVSKAHAIHAGGLSDWPPRLILPPCFSCSRLSVIGNPLHGNAVPLSCQNSSLMQLLTFMWQHSRESSWVSLYKIAWTTYDLVYEDWTIKKAGFSMFSLFIYIYKYVYMAIKSQKPNLKAFAMFYFIVFQLFVPHQAKLDEKTSKACFHENNTCLLPLFIQFNHCRPQGN